MGITTWGCIVGSAVVYAAAFLFPWLSIPFILFFPVPVFYLGITKNQSISFLQGCIWGLIAFGILLHGIIIALFEHAYSLSAALIASIILLGYLSFWSGFWFFFATKISFLYSSFWWRFCVWTLCSWLFIEWIYRGVLIILGKWEGICIVYPLLSLAYYPCLLSAVPFMGEPLLTLLLMIGAAAWCIKRGQYKYSIFFVCYLPFIAGLLFESDNVKKPDWYKRVVSLIPPDNQHTTPWQLGRAITYQLMRARDMYPEATIFILPEASFPFALNNYPGIIDMLTDNALLDDAYLLIGAYRQNNAGNLYTSCYLIYQCRIIQVYDKLNLLSFAESKPITSNLFSISLPLLLKDAAPFLAGTSQIILKSSEFCCLPYLCSELFFDTCCPHIPVTIPILCLVHDRWFSAAYLRQLLLLNAQLKAIAWQHDIIYSCYEGGWCIINTHRERLSAI